MFFFVFDRPIKKCFCTQFYKSEEKNYILPVYVEDGTSIESMMSRSLKYLTVLTDPTPVPYKHVLALQIPGHGAFPPGTAVSFADQFVGHLPSSQVVRAIEFCHFLGQRTGIKMLMYTVPEYRLFKENGYKLDTPQGRVNNLIICYYLVLVVDANDEDQVIKRLFQTIVENRATADAYTDPGDKPGPGFKRTKRGKFRDDVNQTTASQITITTINELNAALSFVCDAMPHRIDTTVPDEVVWNTIANSMSFYTLMGSPPIDPAFEFPPWLNRHALFDISEKERKLMFPAEALKYGLISVVPSSAYAVMPDSLSQYVLPSFISPATRARLFPEPASNIGPIRFKRPLIGTSTSSLAQTITEGNEVYTSSLSCGAPFADVEGLLEPVPVTCKRLFTNLMRLNRDDHARWKSAFQYAIAYKDFLLSLPALGGSPSVYHDLYEESAELTARINSSTELLACYTGKNQRITKHSIFFHKLSTMASIYYMDGMRSPNFIVTALATIQTQGASRMGGQNSSFLSFNGPPSAGKSTIIATMSYGMPKCAQVREDYRTARALTIPINPILVNGILTGEGVGNYKTKFAEDGTGQFVESSGNNKDPAGDALKLIAATSKIISSSKVVQDAETGRHILERSNVGARSDMVSACNGDRGSDGGKSRSDILYTHAPKATPGNSVSSVVPMDLHGKSDEMMGYYATLQLQACLNQLYNANIAYGLANEPSMVLYTIFNIRLLQHRRELSHTEEFRILASPRVVDRCTRSIATYAITLNHTLRTMGFDEVLTEKGFNETDDDVNTRILSWSNMHSYSSTEMMLMSVAKVLPSFTGSRDQALEILKFIKNDCIKYDQHNDPVVREIGGVQRYQLIDTSRQALEERLLQHFPECQDTNIIESWRKLCQASIRGVTDRKQAMETDGDALLFACSTLDDVVCDCEARALCLLAAHYSDLQSGLVIYGVSIAERTAEMSSAARAAYLRTNPVPADVFPHDRNNEYILVGHEADILYPASSACRPEIQNMGVAYDRAIKLLSHNCILGNDKPVIQFFTSADVAEKDQRILNMLTITTATKYEANLQNYFREEAVMTEAMGINIAMLKRAADGDSWTSVDNTPFYNLVPCFFEQDGTLATGEVDKPQVPMTIKLSPFQEPFIVPNPLVYKNQGGLRFLGLMKEADRMFFGTDATHIQIPPGPITETFIVYLRAFYYMHQLPLIQSLPWFVHQWIESKINDEPFQPRPFIPTMVEQEVALDAGTTTIYSMFRKLALEMRAAGLDDPVIAHLIDNPEEKHGHVVPRRTGEESRHTSYTSAFTRPPRNIHTRSATETTSDTAPAAKKAKTAIGSFFDKRKQKK